MCIRLLLVTSHVGTENAGCIRNYLRTALKNSTGLDIEAFENSQAFVTDCNAVMEKVLVLQYHQTKSRIATAGEAAFHTSSTLK